MLTRIQSTLDKLDHHPALRFVVTAALPCLGVFVFLAARLAFDQFTHNDYDVLPYARQFVDPDWIPGDWYLNLKIGYRYAFNVIAGLLCGVFSFTLANTIGRLLLSLLFACGFCWLFRALKIHVLLLIPFLLFFSQEQGFVALERMLLSFEPKIFAYAFVLMSLAALIQSRYRIMFLTLGAALSFHVLVGIYASFCTLCVLLLSAEHRRNRLPILKNSYWLLVTGCLGVFAVLHQLLDATGLPADRAIEASNIYVQLRVPHHVLPSAFGGVKSLAKDVFFYALPIVVAVFIKDRRIRQISCYTLSSLVFVGIGIALDRLGQQHLLKYYWFRFAAVMIPLGSGLAGAAILNLVFEKRRSILDRITSGSKALAYTFRGLLVAGATLLVVLNVTMLLRPQLTTKQTLEPGPSISEITMPVDVEENHQLGRWVRENTPVDSLFLVDPKMESFYVVAHRARVVSFKHAPQTESDILEWHQRLLDISGLEEIDKTGFAGPPFLQSRYCQPTQQRIEKLVEKYDIDYAVYSGCKPELTFPIVYEDSRYRVYSTAP